VGYLLLGLLVAGLVFGANSQYMSILKDFLSWLMDRQEREINAGHEFAGCHFARNRQ
jgi:hypothetical protein